MSSSSTLVIVAVLHMHSRLKSDISIMHVPLLLVRSALHRVERTSVTMLMFTLISYLHAWGVADNDIMLEPLLRPHNQHYSGTLFQVHLIEEADTGVTSLVAVGKALYQFTD